jgi:glycerophosphoryl diester phosphodiesterase
MKKAIERILNLIPVSSSPVTFQRDRIDTQVIAHALGMWKGEKYLNSKDAFETSYEKGVRFFETDISLTRDNKIVLFHDGHESRFGLRKDFSEKEFVEARPFGTELLTAEGLASLLAKYSDARIITDVKDDNVFVLKKLSEIFTSHGIDPKQRIIPQIYHPSEFKAVKALGFKHMIFTVYRFRKRINLTARFLRNHPEISALTVPDKWIDKGYSKLAETCNIDIFVHSISDPKRRDELFRKGVHGIYTHDLF